MEVSFLFVLFLSDRVDDIILASSALKHSMNRQLVRSAQQMRSTLSWWPMVWVLIWRLGVQLTAQQGSAVLPRPGGAGLASTAPAQMSAADPFTANESELAPPPDLGPRLARLRLPMHIPVPVLVRSAAGLRL